jgi:hypothetical protein
MDYQERRQRGLPKMQREEKAMTTTHPRDSGQDERAGFEVAFEIINDYRPTWLESLGEYETLAERQAWSRWHARAAIATVAAPAPTCTGCDPAEGFCRECREAERQAAPAPASAQADTTASAICAGCGGNGKTWSDKYERKEACESCNGSGRATAPSHKTAVPLDPDQMRAAFENCQQYRSKLMFKRGGTVFAEDIPETDYVDSGMQAAWVFWQEAWSAALADKGAQS